MLSCCVYVWNNLYKLCVHHIAFSSMMISSIVMDYSMTVEWGCHLKDNSYQIVMNMLHEAHTQLIPCISSSGLILVASACRYWLSLIQISLFMVILSQKSSPWDITVYVNWRMHGNISIMFFAFLRLKDLSLLWGHWLNYIRWARRVTGIKIDFFFILLVIVTVLPYSFLGKRGHHRDGSYYHGDF